MDSLRDKSQQLLDRMGDLQGRKVLIFGDIGVDEYVQGEVGRISPEAPVPVVEVKETAKKLGLSANVAANVKALGGTPVMFALVGADQPADTLRALLSEREIDASNLMVDPSRPTTTKLRVMSGQHHIVRVDYENKAAVDENVIKQYEPQIAAAISDCDCVIIQDYAKGLIGDKSCQWLIGLAKTAGKKVIVDPYRSTPLATYNGADLMTPNRDEAFDLAKQIPQPEIWQSVEAIGPALAQQLGAQQMVITLGPQGMMIFDDGQSAQIPTFAREVFDVTGAGDTVIAAFALGMAAGWDIRDAGLLANLAAGVVVAQVGAYACTQNDLIDWIKTLP